MNFRKGKIWKNEKKGKFKGTKRMWFFINMGTAREGRIKMLFVSLVQYS